MINVQTNPQITDLAAQVLAMQGDITTLVNAGVAGLVSVQYGSGITTTPFSGVNAFTIAIDQVDMAKSFINLRYALVNGDFGQESAVSMCLSYNSSIELQAWAHVPSAAMVLRYAWEVVTYA